MTPDADMATLELFTKWPDQAVSSGMAAQQRDWPDGFIEGKQGL